MTKFHNSNLLTTSHVIDKYDRADIDRAYNIYLSTENLIEIENLIHDFLSNLVDKREQERIEMQKRVKTSQHVIERIQYMIDYAYDKKNPKMKTARKEYDRMISFLDEVELTKVEQWVGDNGGFEQVLAPEWGKNEP